MQAMYGMRRFAGGAVCGVQSKANLAAKGLCAGGGMGRAKSELLCVDSRMLLGITGTSQWDAAEFRLHGSRLWALMLVQSFYPAANVSPRFGKQMAVSYLTNRTFRSCPHADAEDEPARHAVRAAEPTTRSCRSAGLRGADGGRGVGELQGRVDETEARDRDDPVSGRQQ